MSPPLKVKGAKVCTMYKALIKISARIYWNLERNIPVFRENFKEEVNVPIKATPPCDLRPALRFDVELTRKLLLEYFNDRKSAEVLLPPHEEIILLNKIPYPDLADEIIVEGQVIGHRFFDIRRYRWRFKPIYAGVSKILDKRIGFYAIVNLPRITRLYVIHRSDILESNLPQTKGEYVAIETKNGIYQGLGKSIRGDRIKVLKAWRKRRHPEIGKSNSWREAVEANRDWLLSKENESIKFLQEVAKKLNIPRDRIFVSFSGGKDSLATLLISTKAFGNIPVLFNDTGIELPETVEYVKRMADKLGLELICASGDQRFFEGLEFFGPPARDYRWCCKVVKLAPILDAINARFKEKPVLSIVGQRKYESIARAFSPSVWTNKWLPGVISTTPIQEWTALQVWLYLFLEKAEINELYFQGFDRLGCWLCPASEVAELQLVAKRYPKLWSRWESYLESFRKAHGLDRDWIRFHLWRWKELPGDQRRLLGDKARKSLEEPTLDILIVKGEGVSKVSFKHSYLGELVLRVPPSDLVYLVIDSLKRVDNFLEMYVENIRVTCDSRFYNIYTDDDEAVKKIATSLAKITIRVNYCLRCKLCVNNCPSNAILLDESGQMRFLREKCTKCYICNEKCPLLSFLSIQTKVLDKLE
ncbi:MAG: hypothetical protein DRJ51_02505 [Thermoprotei archaeon]|nr:MAG: hypothetical protein DRJ51_02505 [Thermoprotei archaeon]